ncbi:hypothetical protein P154DRAFT_537143 [Amniculicola lignicola CBS 123094]|uniref:F-box domain-containing protein n=1 Tax=Amniculicola lignicola CBS 123094 TaxID=1392246 RepID=A0A6A5WE66_9PLEO|nr:hypothetical protein P154DRAFT_537143 [Amniculicola lignicola CBS 123094]
MAPRKPVVKKNSKAAKKVTKGEVAKPVNKFRRFRNGMLNVNTSGAHLEKARKNATQSPLLRLPAELRSKIFDYALYHGDLTTETIRDAGRRHAVLKPKIANCLSLLTTCRQTYDETALKFFQLNTFVFDGIDHDGNGLNDLRIWIRALKKTAYRTSVKNVRLSMTIGGFYGSSIFADVKYYLCPFLKEASGLGKLRLVIADVHKYNLTEQNITNIYATIHAQVNRVPPVAQVGITELENGI